MTGSGSEEIQRAGEHFPSPLEAGRRSEEEARTEIKRRLWFTPVALVIIAMVAFILGDWVYGALMGGLLAFGVVRLVGEMREPRRYLKVSSSQLVRRVLSNRDFWEGRGKNLGGPEQMAQLQDLLDSLSPGHSWLRLNSPRVAKWTGILASAVWIVFAVVMVMAGEGLLASLVPLVAASLFGASVVWVDRAESRRKEAIALLEEARGDTEHAGPVLRAPHETRDPQVEKSGEPNVP